jgi:hypothetical protein
MKGLAWYYVTRLALVALWLLVIMVAGLPVWLSVPTAAAMVAYFVWLPRSGRYVVRQDRPLTPMRRDERSLAISGRAAAWAFVVETLLAGAGMGRGVAPTGAHRLPGPGAGCWYVHLLGGSGLAGPPKLMCWGLAGRSGVIRQRREEDSRGCLWGGRARDSIRSEGCPRSGRAPARSHTGSTWSTR